MVLAVVGVVLAVVGVVSGVVGVVSGVVGVVSGVVGVVLKFVGVVTGMPSTSVVGGIPCLPPPPSPQLSLVFIDAAEVVKLTGYAILKR